MNKKKKIIFKGISERAASLLKCQEGMKVEFKESIKVLDQEDLVSFANSDQGGSILIGIIENKNKSGLQETTIKGCEIGDKPKLDILEKSKKCIPPIHVEIIYENESNENHFIRIEIPSGNNKPYCTQKGIYKIRGDGQNQALTPERLLQMFLEKENESFMTRFKEAANNIDKRVRVLSNCLNDIDNKLTPLLEQFFKVFGKEENENDFEFNYSGGFTGFAGLRPSIVSVCR